MDQYAYPEAEQHRREHQLFDDKIRAFRQRIVKPKGRLCPEVVAFCKNWWQTHVQGSDKRLGAFLNNKGVGQLNSAPGFCFSHSSESP